MTESQLTRIKSYLKAGNSLTPIDALNMFNCFRLSARIADLRADGLNVKTEMVKDGKKHYARYFIESI